MLGPQRNECRNIGCGIYESQYSSSTLLNASTKYQVGQEEIEGQFNAAVGRETQDFPTAVGGMEKESRYIEKP
jgi:hypothetical protein